MEWQWLQKPLTHLAWATAAVVALHVLCNLPMQVQDRRVQRELLAADRRAQREIKQKVAEIKLSLIAKKIPDNTVIAGDVHKLGHELGVGYDWMP